jgi:hypothetical protein
MRVQEIMDLIPHKIFEFLAMETQVDYQVKKLNGETLFKLILFSMLESNKLSLRVMERFLESAKFKQFNQSSDLSSKYNSIRDRICTINPEYFERLFSEIFTIYNKELGEEHALSKVDSTYVSIASKLISFGMKNGTKGEGKTQLKYSIQLKGSLPASVKVFTEQSYISEDLALSEIINQSACIEDNIVVFDRGLQKRSSLETFTKNNKWFVTRGALKIRCKVQEINEIKPPPVDSTISISSDVKAYLYNEKHETTQYLYRVIKGRINESGEPIIFVSNLLEEDAYFIAQLYKQRWEIEVFFKYIKQHLNISHLVSRDKNGIKVMIYMTLILAILILVYKKKNKINGFKMAKLAFSIELENEIIKTIVLLCGGNPDKAAHLFGYG